MSNANVKLVQDLYDAFKRGDIATIIGALTPDVHWQVHGRATDFPTIGQWSGPRGAEEFFRRVDESLEVAEFTPHQLHAAGDKVFVLGHYRWKVRRSGKPASAEWCHAFTIRNGKVAVFREFTDTATFAEAAEDRPVYDAPDAGLGHAIITLPSFRVAAKRRAWNPD